MLLSKALACRLTAIPRNAIAAIAVTNCLRRIVLNCCKIENTMRLAAVLFALPSFWFCGIACGEECSADGIVVHAITGQPVPNAQVAADSPDSRGAATDVNGTFVIPGVPCGRLRLTVTGLRFFPSRVDQTEFHDIRIQLAPESAVGGAVTDANGNPVQGARIQVYLALAIGGTHDLHNLKPIMELNAESGTWRAPLPAFPGYVLCAGSDTAL